MIYRTLKVKDRTVYRWMPHHHEARTLYLSPQEPGVICS